MFSFFKDMISTTTAPPAPAQGQPDATKTHQPVLVASPSPEGFNFSATFHSFNTMAARWKEAHQQSGAKNELFVIG